MVHAFVRPSVRSASHQPSVPSIVSQFRPKGDRAEVGKGLRLTTRTRGGREGEARKTNLSLSIHDTFHLVLVGMLVGKVDFVASRVLYVVEC